MSFLTGTQIETLYTLQSAVTKNTYTTQAAFSGVIGTNTVCALPAGFSPAITRTRSAGPCTWSPWAP